MKFALEVSLIASFLYTAVIYDVCTCDMFKVLCPFSIDHDLDLEKIVRIRLVRQWKYIAKITGKSFSCSVASANLTVLVCETFSS